MIVLSHPEWWLDHVDELVDALAIAAESPDANAPDLAVGDEVVIEDPAWWLDHIDELADALSRAAAEREAGSQWEPDADQEATGSRQWGDVDAMIARREERAAQERDEARRTGERHREPDTEHTWVDLERLREQRQADPPPQRPPDHDRDRGGGR